MTTTTRRKAKKASAREAHFFWIDISSFYNGYTIWKEIAPLSKKPIVCVGRSNNHDDLPDMEREFDFAPGDLGRAFEELAGRKAAKGGYGEVEIGASSLMLYRLDRYDYQVEAPCGEAAHLRAGELRALVSAVEELPVSTVAV